MVNRLFLLITFVLLTVTGCGQAEPEVTSTLKLKKNRYPVWMPEQTFVSRLDRPETQASFSIQPPIGFTQSHRLNSKLYQWAGPRRKDSTSAVLQVEISSQRKPANLNKALDSKLNGIKRRRNNWTESELAAGEIGGHKFVKRTWQANHRTNGAEMNGVYYVGQIDEMLVSLSAQEVGPNRNDTLKLCEAALLSFRQSNGTVSPSPSTNRLEKEPIKIPASGIGPIKEATRREFDQFVLQMPKRFSLGITKELKSKFFKGNYASWIIDEDDKSTNAMVVGMAFSSKRVESARQKLVNVSAGFTDSVGIEIQQRDKTQTFDSPAGPVTGFRFFGTLAPDKSITGYAYLLTSESRNAAFVLLVHEGPPNKIAQELIASLATIELKK